MFKFIKRFLVVATVIVAASGPSAAYARVLASNAGGGTARPVIVVSSPHPSRSSSFQWGDAGIGAAGIIALAGIVMGATVMVRRRVGHPLAS